MDFSLLNKEQRAAVLYEDGALLILAGAGSGKTRVLTSKIAYLIQEKQLPPWKILAFTFTNKAAAEMKSRVAEAMGRPVDSMWIGTFHSICSRILRREIDRLGYNNNFTIYDSQDQKNLVKQVIKGLLISDDLLPPAQALHRISDAKNRGFSPEDMEKAAVYDRDIQLARVYKHYEQEKRKNNALDFDDLINKTLEILADFPEVLDKYRSQFEWVFVDEYQDTNQAQYRLILALTGEKSRLCVVGDADQSIYGWRGADISNILNFEKDFPSAKTIKLEQNYRSTKTILKAANKLIANNENRRDKNLWTENEEGREILFKIVNNEYEEAQQVVNWMHQLKHRGHSFSEMAVLYRTNAQSRAFEEALIQEGIPYRVIGGLKFYDRAEIKDLIAYMTLTVNPTDDVSFRRIVNQPKRGIGTATVDRLQNLADSYGLSLMDALAEEEILNNLSKAQRDKFQPFIDLMAVLREGAEGALSAFVEKVYTESGYRAMLENSTAVEDRSRIENVDAFFGAIAQHEDQDPEANLIEYLQNLSLMSDMDKAEEAAGVSLMTVHSAKGLEFPVVFIAGLEDGLFPSRMTMEEGNLEEERRLMYVAMTRAEKRLYLSQAQTRRVFGQLTGQKISRFLEELGDTVHWDQPRDIYVDPMENEDFRPEIRSYANRNYVPRKGFSDPEIRAQYDAQRERMRKLVQEKKAAMDESMTTSLRAGDKIRHRRFGQGTIVSVQADPDGDELVVAFDKKGLKRLNAALAPITKL